MQTKALLLVAGFAHAALAQYTVADNFTEGDFFSQFQFFQGQDPTGGFVNYLDAGTAQQNNLTYKNAQGQIYMGVDSTTSLNAGSTTGRDSVRIASTKTYTHYLTVIDLAHMPGGVCGTWPAFWSFGNGGSGWPQQGEIDIIEGANDQSVNFMTLHTKPNCSVSSSSGAQLQPVANDCNTAANGNEGCTFHASDPASYGSAFNQQGGGVYAAEWTSQGISIWYWPRGKQPADALSASPSPAAWGAPTSAWAGSGCDWDDHFVDHNIVFDTTFCGQMGNSSFQSCAASNAGQTCNAFVATNPAAFSEAYWLVNSLVVYQTGANAGNGTVPSGSSTLSGQVPASTAAPGQPPASTGAAPPWSATAEPAPPYSTLQPVQEPSAGPGTPVAPFFPASTAPLARRALADFFAKRRDGKLAAREAARLRAPPAM